MSPDEMKKLQKIGLMMRSFSPSAPVDDRDLFAYRDKQFYACFNAVFQRGKHIALFGERGVGKTSLANVLPTIISDTQADGLSGYRIDCNSEDTFETLWQNVFKEIGIDADIQLGPEDVRRALASLRGEALIVIDELDRWEDDLGLSLLADTIKTLSDHSTRVTLMLVGVADSLMHLMGEHGSIIRSMAQVQMPRMSQRELGNIIEKGLAITGTKIEGAAKAQIIDLSEGLPHYTHLLAQSAGVRAIQDDRDTISSSDVAAAMSEEVDKHSFKTEYDVATSSPQRDTLFARVLLACAYAPRDELGFFRPSDVREPLSIIMGKDMPIPTYQGHLNKFSSDERGFVLTKEGARRRYRYRFSNPLLQPYTKIRAIAHGDINEDIREKLEDARRTHDKFGPSGQGDLF